MKGLDDKEAAEEVAKHFSSISQEYEPLNTSQLPAYLPAQEVLQVDETEVAERIFKLKNRRSTQPCDLPSKLRKMYPNELATPLANIINSCLSQYHYPKPWKHEWVVPAEKVPNPSIWRFKHVDDLSVLELVLLTGLLTEYNLKLHVASNIGIDE